jgi:hypothetical protein
LYSFSVGVNIVARVDGINIEPSKECITLDGYECYYQMTRLVETFDCPTSVKTTSGRIWTAFTVVGGLAVGLVIGRLVQLSWNHYVAKQQQQQQDSGESRQQPTG